MLMKYVKPNGTEVQINTDPVNIKAAEKLGWKPAKEKKAGASASGAITLENIKE